LQHTWTIFLLGGVLILVVCILWPRFRKSQLVAARQSAILRFEELRQALEDLFLQQAAATGKPRGLRWMACELQGDPLFAVDPKQDTLFALVTTTIRFEAIEGGDMEEVEAVGNLRSATAVFVYHNDQWTTDGRAVFNLGRMETCKRFQLVAREGIEA
jgi:hypothetical protein